MRHLFFIFAIFTEIFSFAQAPENCTDSIFINGSMNGTQGEGVVANGWSIVAYPGYNDIVPPYLNTPDVNDDIGPAFTTTGYFWVGTPVASPNGGNWQNAYGPEVFETTLINLTPGETYIITFYYALTPLTNILSPVGADIYIDGWFIETTPLATTQWQWILYSFTFTATATSHTFSISPSTDSYLGVDGFCISTGDIEAYDDEICENETANVYVVSTFGDGNYTYNWSDGTPNNLDNIDVSPTVTTDYYVTVTDGTGQQMIDTATVTVNPLPTINLGNDITICNGDNINIDAGTGYNSYLWSTTETTQIINASSQGTYEVTITGNNGCSNSDAIDLTIAANPTPTITGNDFCEGYSTTLDAGAGYQSYSWNPSSSSTQTINITGGGTYSVIVTDVNGCEGTNNITITMNPTPTVDAGADIDICNGETATLTATSSASSFTWDNGLGSVNPQTVTPNTTTTYTVSVSDANGCTNSDEVIVNVHAIPSASVTSTDISCNGSNDGSVDLTVNNGTPPYSYHWNNGDNTEDISNLAAGTYNVTVDDSYNCSTTNSANITEPSGMNITGSSINANCYGDDNLNIDVTVSGGSTPYSYIWSNGETTQDIINITAGVYTVTVTDNNACSQISSFNIVEPNELIISLPNDFTHCNNNTDITATVEGGTTPYSYIWDDGSTNQTIQYQTNNTQTYFVTVTDNNGCTASDNITITISYVELNAYTNTDSVCPGEPVLVTTDVIGGIPPYTIYNNGQVSTFPVMLYPNEQENYTLQVVDACGNTDDAIVDLNVYPITPISFTADILQGCMPLTVYFNLENNSNNMDYIWNFDDNNENNLSLIQNPVHIFETAGLYDISVSVTDKNGCKNQLTINDMIEVYPKPDAKFYIDEDVVSFIDAGIYFENHSIDNLYNYWSFDDGDSSITVDPNHNYQMPGIYYPSLIVENEYGCLDTAINTIEVKDEFTLYVPTAFSPDNDGINDGFKAVGHGIDLDNYYIAVYDRWGEIIWNSTDLFDEWKGTAKNGNKTVQVGTYKWLVVCKDFNGVEHTKSGNLTVMR